ncbi:MAG: T9SS type A sorting domain-containing protein [Flavobacteriales bacterium]|nr:T9SS type A sorting domain-containing protein [Flavobacteriales bacterium]
MFRSIIAPLLLLTFIMVSNSSFAQLKFPNGNNLKLITSDNVLYLETRILFTVGKNKVEDYKWKKISDSLDTRWLVTSCFNGDCRNDLLDTGTFHSDFGLNDTTCFIAFHVESHDLNGRSKIKYKVYHKSNPSDSAILTYDITYAGLSGIDKQGFNKPIVWPNPSSELIFLNNLRSGSRIQIVNTEGQLVYDQISTQKDTAINLIQHLKNNGVYQLIIIQPDSLIRKKLVFSQ